MDNMPLNTVEDVEQVIEFAALDLPARNGLLEMARAAIISLFGSGLIQSPTLGAITNRIKALLEPKITEDTLTSKKNQMFLIDEFANDPLEAIRLFEFGDIYKDGVKREFTKEFAEKMILPHYKPAIKLGGHDDTLPGAGRIMGLEVRDDGLYGIPEFNPNGLEAINEKHYHYHSPEVIWDGWMEDPKTGDPIEGPIIAGLALLHDPHLGESATLFTVEPYNKPEIKPEDNGMTTEKIEVPTGFFVKLNDVLDKFSSKKEDEPNDEQREEFAALEKQRDDYAAELTALKAEKEQAEARKAIKEKFNTDEHGEAFTEMGKDDAVADMLAGMTEEQRDWTMKQLAGLSAQADPNITGELGDAGEPVDETPKGVLHSAVQEYASKNEMTYEQAFKAIQKDRHDLVTNAGVK
jgi:hypothetical protein